ARVAKTAAQAERALDVLTARLAEVAETAHVDRDSADSLADGWAGLGPLVTALAPSLAVLAGRAESLAPWERRLRALATAAAAAGRGSLAERLVSACGPGRPDALVGSLAPSA